MTNRYIAQVRASAAGSPTLTSIKRAASKPAPARPAGWDRMSATERRAHQLVAQTQKRVQDRDQAIVAQKRNLPSNWERGSAIDKREWMLANGGKNFSDGK
jgi:hypothetical protein